jgi:hypothetical protein
MKKLVFGLVAILTISNLSYGQKKINKKKAGFMAVCDVIAGSASVSLGPYGVLWGGFIGSCGGAVLWEDMFNRSSSASVLIEPLVKNNPDSFFNEYALVGKLHNDLMIKYCNKEKREYVFVNNKISDYIKNEILQSNYFEMPNDKKVKFINNLSVYDNTIKYMADKESSITIINELERINNFSTEEKYFYNQIINFNSTEEFTPEETFNFINELENTIKNESKLNEESKIKLYYCLEIFRYSYALWYQNIPE